MEGTATVEQAEPQGSAAPGQDTSAPANGDNGQASPASFGAIYRQHVMDRGARIARAGVSSADREPSATDEQPAASPASASRPGAGTTGVDGPAGVEADSPASPDQPRLTRAQRKALRSGQPAGDAPPEAATAGTSAPADDDDDPVIARVGEIEQKVTEGLSRLEGLIRPQQAAPEASPDDEDAVLFGADDEFSRRAEIALHGSQRGQYLTTEEQDELAVWASNRKARDRTAGRVSLQERSQFSAAILAAAEEFGIDTAALQKPGTTLRDVFGAFVSQGATKQGAELTAANEKIAKLEQANRLLADENEALQGRAPGSGRSVLRGGDAAQSRAAHLADRSRMNARQLMESGLRQQMQGRRSRPGAR